MTQEEAKQRLMSRIQYLALDNDDLLALQTLIPELQESEDEKIRKQIEQALIEHDWSATYNISKDDCLVWLEKQKEQKPAECIPDSVKFEEGFKTGREVGFREGVESVKPLEWSEEDERILHNALVYMSYASDRKDIDKYSFYEAENWLKSLRPQSNWKPTEEQMEALDNARFCKSYDRSELDSLYEDLKKL